jgi:ABC-type dipeptide/oligopeptide/nickel transport system permease subunit
MIGLVGGYIRWLDAIVMRVMDGLMAIPAILLAIASSRCPGRTRRGHHRHRHSGNSARRAPRPLGRAVHPRRAVRRGRHAVGTRTPLLLVSTSFPTPSRR